MTLENLYKWANELSLKHWGVLFTAKIKLTKRKWTTKNGHFQMPRAFETIPTIGFSSTRNAERQEDEVKGTLLHELVHWRLWSQRIPHRDTDNEFIEECLRVGAPISKGTKAKNAYEQYLKLRNDLTA